MPFQDEVDGVITSIRNSVALQLRSQFLYVEKATLTKLLDDSIRHLQRGLLQQEAEMRNKQARTDFMSLSAELRNTIYEMALCRGDGKSLIIDKAIRPRGQAAQLRVSRVINQEASSIFYGSNSFELNSSLSSGFLALRPPRYPRGVSRYLVQWLRSIGPNAALIKCVSLEIWSDECSHVLLRNLLGSCNGLENTGLTVNQTLLKVLGLLGKGLSDKVFTFRAVTSVHWLGRHKSKDLYGGVDLDGHEPFSGELPRRLKLARDWRRDFGTVRPRRIEQGSLRYRNARALTATHNNQDPCKKGRPRTQSGPGMH